MCRTGYTFYFSIQVASVSIFREIASTDLEVNPTQNLFGAIAYLLVLIGRHGDEFRLLENVTPERRIRKLQDIVSSHEVKPRLILVHRVQYRLQ